MEKDCVLYMVFKGLISKRKLMADLHLIMTSGKIAGKRAIATIITTPLSSAAPSTATCPPWSRGSTNSAAATAHRIPTPPPSTSAGEEPTAAGVRACRPSTRGRSRCSDPMFWAWCLRAGFDPSPAPRVRQLRITDSSFPVVDADEDCQVDREAEEFIGRFYEQLRLQKKMSALEARFYDEMMINGSDSIL